MVNYGVSRGCETCKKRRKKCDETRPVCKRCSKLGIICSGYQHGTGYVFRNTLPRQVTAKRRDAVEYSDSHPTRHKNSQALMPAFQQSPNSAFGVTDQICSLFQPLFSGRPIWSSQAAMHMTDDEWSSLHSYWSWVPNKTYPFKALLTYNPTESRDYYYAIINNEASVRSVLMMRALMIAVAKGEHRSEEMGCHVSKVCSTVNRELNSSLEHVPSILLEVISVLALVAAYLGLYRQWDVHMNGLNKMIEVNGGADALSAELATKLRRADLKGASALLVAPRLPFQKRFENASVALPSKVRSAITGTTTALLLPCGFSIQTISNIKNLSIFARALTLALYGRPPGSVMFDPYAVTEEWQWCQHQLLCTPLVLRGGVPLKRCNCGDCSDCMSLKVSDVGLSWEASIELTLRACAILYANEMVFCRDWPRNLGGYSVPLRFVLRHIEAICRRHGSGSLTAQHMGEDGSWIDPLSNSQNNDCGAFIKPVLIWICLFVNAVSLRADQSEDHLGSEQYDRSIFQDCIVHVIGLEIEDVDTLSEDDLMLCRLLDLRHIVGPEWDDRLGLKQLLEGTPH